MLWLCLHSASICNLLERLFTLCQYLQSSGKVLCTLPVSAIFWKGSLHSAIICNLLERLFTLCQYLQSSERLFTFCCILYISQCTCIFLFLEILHWKISVALSHCFIERVRDIPWKKLPESTGIYRNLPDTTTNCRKTGTKKFFSFALSHWFLTSEFQNCET